MQKIVKILIVITLVLALTLPGAAVFTDLGKPIDENTGNNPREDAPPYIPSNPNPKNGAIGVDINTNLSWNGGDPDEGDEVFYAIYFGTDSSKPPYVETIGPYPWNQKEISWDPGMLDYITLYYWKIIASDGGGSVTPGPIWNFTTEEQPNNPPYIPSNPDPENGAIGIDINTDLSWDGGDPDPGDEVFYYIFFGTDPNPPYIENIGPYPAEQIEISWDPGTLEYLTKYYWKILAYDGDAFVIGQIWNFTTEEANNPPYTPSNPDPANGSTGVDIDANLSWDGGDPDLGDRVYYEIFFGTDPDPPYVGTIGPYPWNQIRISLDPGILDYNTHYYWKIVAYDNFEHITSGPIWDFTTEEPPNNPPDVPSNPNPPDGATDVSIDADLSWTCSDPDGDPVTYDVYFGTISPPPKVASNITITAYDPGTLDYETTYYWKIVAWDNHGAHTEGPIWDFITEEPPNNPPYIPSNPNPADGAIGINIDEDLSWTGGDPDLGDIVTYDVYFGTSSSPPKVVSNQSATFYDPGTMNYNTTYYWQIVSWDNHGASTPGPIWDFITEEQPNNPPYMPSNPNPANSSTGVSISTDLSWDGGDPDLGDQVLYYIFFGTDPDPPYVDTIGPYPWNQIEITWDPGTLDYNTRYYWKIIAYDGQYYAIPDFPWEFTTEEQPNNPPYMPSNPDPENGSTGVSIDAVLSWSGGDPDPDDEVYYDIYFGTDPTPPFVETIGPYPAEQTAISWDPGTLEYNTHYYWQIVAHDDEFYASGSIWDFTTEEQPNNPPYIPSNPNPENGATGVDIDENLSWTGGDPDGDPVTYDVYFGTSIHPPKVISNQSETFYDPGTMNYNTTYYWQIIAWDNHEASTSGPIWNFTTEEEGNSPPNDPVILSGPTAAGAEISLNFSAVTTDPDGDQVFYNFSWGDENYSGWIGPFNSSENITAGYSWIEEGYYEVQVKAKDIHEKESDWSEPHNISISTQMEFENIKRGFVHFRLGFFNESYAYIYLLDTLGFSVVLSSDILSIETNATEAVSSVTFKVTNLFWGDNVTFIDYNISDGFSHDFVIPTGLWELTAYAYDEDENLIDKDKIDYLVFFSRGGDEGQFRRVSKLRDRLRTRLLNR